MSDKRLCINSEEIKNAKNIGTLSRKEITSIMYLNDHKKT